MNFRQGFQMILAVIKDKLTYDSFNISHRVRLTNSLINANKKEINPKNKVCANGETVGMSILTLMITKAILINYFHFSPRAYGAFSRRNECSFKFVRISLFNSLDFAAKRREICFYP